MLYKARTKSRLIDGDGIGNGQIDNAGTSINIFNGLPLRNSAQQ